MPVALDIVSPEKLLLSTSVEMVVLPAYEGEVGVLPGHSPMILLLKGGAIRTYEGGQVKQSLFVSGGFAEVTTERVTVLATEAMASVDRAEADRRVVAAEAEYAAADKADMTAVDAAMDKMQSARAMVEAAG